MMDNKEQRLFELKERVREIMGMDDIIEKRPVPSYETHSFHGDSPSKIQEDIASWCGWRPSGVLSVVDLSYTSHVRQDMLVDVWTNHTEYTAMVIFEKVYYKAHIANEFKEILCETEKVLGIESLGLHKSIVLVRKALGL